MVREQLWKKSFFSPRGPWWTHRWPPPCAGRAALRLHQVTTAAPSDHWYGGLGVSLGESEGWKPQKVRGCGWTRCPRNRILSHVAQDTVRAWFRGVGAYCAVFGAFWHLFGPFLGHIVELKGTRGLFDTVKSSRTWSVATVFLRLGVSPGFGGYFGRKWLFLAQNSADLGGHLPTWRHRPGPPLVSFWLKTWIWQGHHLGSKMATWANDPKRWDGAMAKTARRRVVVVACCCLLLVVS